jgi:hypothetical protein
MLFRCDSLRTHLKIAIQHVMGLLSGYSLPGDSQYTSLVCSQIRFRDMLRIDWQ